MRLIVFFGMPCVFCTTLYPQAVTVGDTILLASVCSSCTSIFSISNKIFWYGWWDLNLRPLVPQTSALTN